jgi:uncharacterized protein YlxP (DUF503 family)
MFVGICRLELYLLESNSLKEKRQVIRSIIERLKNRFNISIAEVGCQDALRRAEIGLAVVSNETIHLEKVIGKVVNFIESNGQVEIIKMDKDIY